MHLQIDNFLQIWIFESKNIGRSVIFNLKKMIEKDYILAEKFTPEVSRLRLEVKDSPMMLCNQPRRLSRD